MATLKGESIVDIMNLLHQTGINPFAAKLLAESWDRLDQKVKAVIPSPLIFTIGNCEIRLRDSLSDIGNPHTMERGDLEKDKE
jgi:hypothetical protein